MLSAPEAVRNPTCVRDVATESDPEQFPSAPDRSRILLGSSSKSLAASVTPTTLPESLFSMTRRPPPAFANPHTWRRYSSRQDSFHSTAWFSRDISRPPIFLVPLTEYHRPQNCAMTSQEVGGGTRPAKRNESGRSLTLRSLRRGTHDATTAGNPPSVSSPPLVADAQHLILG